MLSNSNYLNETFYDVVSGDMKFYQNFQILRLYRSGFLQ